MSDLIKITDSARARIQKLMTISDDKSVIGIQIGSIKLEKKSAHQLYFK